MVARIVATRWLSALHETAERLSYNAPMVTLDDVARFLGLSKRAVRMRVSALGETLNGYLTRGARNRLIFKGEAVALLRRLEELRREEGLRIQQAADRLKDELGDEDSPSGLCIVIQPDVETEVLKEVIREICQERDRWRDYAQSLESVLPNELKWLTQTSPVLPEDRRLN
jgi:predicted transcriptional regulator